MSTGFFSSPDTGKAVLLDLLIEATPIILCMAKSSQFAVGPLNLSSPSAISVKGTLSKTVVTFSPSSSALKTLKKMML